jgi:hydroxymethylbilane synthase
MPAMNEWGTVKIGTRKSELATWQARQVAKRLSVLGCKTELIYITSEGDKDQKTPLPEMGGRGVFTKAVDIALLNGKIDLGVHSFKDLPTENPLPLIISAVLERADSRDSLVAPEGLEFLENPSGKAVIATGSNRRKAQWLNRYPNHTVVNLRGNVNTRLEKVNSNNWNGAIFAAAGLQRINLDQHISQYLDWMIPAPAQGAMAVMVREDDKKMREITSRLNDEKTETCTTVERDFLHEMEAGCSAPVGAWARIEGKKLHFTATALTTDGEERFDFEKSVSMNEAKGLGEKAAHKMLDEGAAKVIEHG